MGFLVSLIVVIYGLLWFIDTRTAVGLSGLYSFYEFLSYLAWAVSVFWLTVKKEFAQRLSNVRSR